jgi:hypothetical protein
MIAIGDTLTREDGKRYVLSGIDGDGQWVGTPVDDFGPPETLPAQLLASSFGVTDAIDAPKADEDEGWKLLAAANAVQAHATAEVKAPPTTAEAATQAKLDRPLSPEGRFAADAQEGADPVDHGGRVTKTRKRWCWTTGGVTTRARSSRATTCAGATRRP